MSDRSPKIQLEEIIMRPTERTAYPSWTYGPLGGAALAVGLGFAYAALFTVYATIRSSVLVIRVNPDAVVPGMIVAYFFTLAVPALVIAAMMASPGGSRRTGRRYHPEICRHCLQYIPQRRASDDNWFCNLPLYRHACAGHLSAHARLCFRRPAR
jgi:hypothetical protein